MRWSLLCLTQPSRSQFLQRLNAVLRPQLEGRLDIEFRVKMFEEQMDLGSNRQKMIEEARGDYVCFIDDDDLVSADYVQRIYPLLDGVDYVGFNLQMYSDGVKQKPTAHSLRYPEWNADEHGYYRDISHLNPIRRELALCVKMSGGFGEDERWARELRALGLVKTEHFVHGDPCYLYLWRSNKNEPPMVKQFNPATQRYELEKPRSKCPECGSTSTGMAGGMRRCNQCAASWAP